LKSITYIVLFTEVSNQSDASRKTCLKVRMDEVDRSPSGPPYPSLHHIEMEHYEVFNSSMKSFVLFYKSCLLIDFLSSFYLI